MNEACLLHVKVKLTKKMKFPIIIFSVRIIMLKRKYKSRLKKSQGRLEEAQKFKELKAIKGN